MNNRIRFGEPIELALKRERLPPRALLTHLVTNERKEPFQVYITEEAHRKAWQHVRGSPNVECGGILMGYPFQTLDRQITFVVIVDVILQNSDNRSVGHFTVSPAGIAEARIKIERDGYFSVGWYHSHPGHGVFLSGQDMTIVRSIYNSDWHMAWVIDPLREKEAFFRGAEGKRLSGHYLLSEIPESVKASAFFTKAQEARISGNESRNEAKKTLRLLKKTLDDPESGLAHWKETGRYQEVEDALRELLSEEVQRLSEEDITSVLKSDVTGSEKRMPTDDLMQISERYDQAIALLQDALCEYPPQSVAISNAWQTLKWIKETSPGYKDVGQLTCNSGRILEILRSPNRRLSLEKSRELEELLSLLRQLL
jgi:proteasome lid subunit RPN8/RPN11